MIPRWPSADGDFLGYWPDVYEPASRGQVSNMMFATCLFTNAVILFFWSVIFRFPIVFVSFSMQNAEKFPSESIWSTA